MLDIILKSCEKNIINSLYIVQNVFLAIMMRNDEYIFIDKQVVDLFGK